MDLVRRLNVGGYPSLLLFKNKDVGSQTLFKGDRTVESIMAFLEQQTEP